jgi:hypothetical protein
LPAACCDNNARVCFTYNLHVTPRSCKGVVDTPFGNQSTHCADAINYVVAWCDYACGCWCFARTLLIRSHLGHGVHSVKHF